MVGHRSPVGRDLIVVGGSAGAIAPLQEVLQTLPVDLPASILVVIHQPEEGSPGLLPWLLSEGGTLPARHAEDGDTPRPGHVYVAPPDRHLLVDREGRLCLSSGPKENRFRPAIDPLFRTAARAYGPRVIAVLLSGLLDDGSLGLMSVNRFGGVAVVQDPADATAPDMPASAIRNAPVDHVLKASQIADALVRLVREPIPTAAGAAAKAPHGVPTMSDRKQHDTVSGAGPNPVDVTVRGDDALTSGALDGPPSGFTCPECGGALWELVDGTVLHYRCHVGHRFTADSVATAYQEDVEATLWAAMRMFQENAALNRRLAERAEEGGLDAMASRHHERSRESEARSEVVRRLLLNEPPPSSPSPPRGTASKSGGKHGP